MRWRKRDGALVPPGSFIPLLESTDLILDMHLAPGPWLPDRNRRRRTGHNGLSYIFKLGVDIIKIDKMFVDAIRTEAHSRAIVDTLVDLARNLRMQIVAEGVEDFEQVVFLRDRGISSAQGFVFAPALPGSAFLQLVEAIDPVAPDRAGVALGPIATEATHWRSEVAGWHAAT